LKKYYDYGIVTYDMSSYVVENQTMDFIGVDKGYGAAGPGQLTSIVRNKPKTVCILENFDKAHCNIQRIFRNIILDGFLKDQFGYAKKLEVLLNDKDKDEQDEIREKYEEIFNEDNSYALTKDNYNEALQAGFVEFNVDFSKTVVIITTQKGDSVYKKPKFIELLYQEDNSTFDMLLDSITNFTKSEQSQPNFCPIMKTTFSVMKLVPVLPLEFKYFLEVVKESIERKSNMIQQQYDIHITITDKAYIVKALVLSCGPNFNLTKVQNNSLYKLFDPIVDLIRDKHKKNNIKKIRINISETSKKNIDDIINYYL